MTLGITTKKSSRRARRCRSHLISIPSVAMLLAGSALAQEGRPANLFPLEGLVNSEMAVFELGEAEFFRVWTREEGVGPFFNAPTCANCHFPQNGLAGYPGSGVTIYGQSVTGSDGKDLFLPAAGRVLRKFSNSGFAEEIPEWANAQESRKTPQLMGLGLVEAVPDAVFDQLAAGNGGRVVRSPETGRVMRWGSQNQVATLLEFVRGAYHVELGMALDETGPLPPVLNWLYLLLLDHPEPVVNAALRLLVAQGEVIFTEIGCASCHTPTLRTADGPFTVNGMTIDIEALQGVEFHPYSDFLLHDMGLMDRSDVHLGQAGKQEFRTSALWGQRFDQNNNFHDGSIPHYPMIETMLRHDGEAAAAREAWQTLTSKEQEALRRFVSTR